jgi:peptidoglycan/LPS O-acetylase OafA/YrhL
MKGSLEKLDALTSLRFVAAAMIVFFHVPAEFGLSLDPYKPFMLGHAVSFFFVLSGFILALVYPDLEGKGRVGRFWLARFARLWPVHIAAFISTFILFDAQWKTHFALVNLLMLQAWFPLLEYLFVYNSVSWSISVECFFTCAFRFLCWTGKKHGHGNC